MYNMQLSNGPAEQLAAELVASGNGAFELCGFVSGGLVSCSFLEANFLHPCSCIGSEAMEAALKLARQVQLLTINTTVIRISFDFFFLVFQSISNTRGNSNVPTLLHATFLTMVTLSAH